MGTLNNVCMWKDKQWKRITVEEAKKIFPNNTVSANSRIFMCELCGQYVTLTMSKTNTRHFRHKSDTDENKCPDRSAYNSSYKDLKGQIWVMLRLLRIIFKMWYRLKFFCK